MRESRKIIAKIMVILSRFFSIRPVPEEVLYSELAIASEIPVPLPECIRTSSMVAMPERNMSTRRTMLRGFTETPCTVMKQIQRIKIAQIGKGGYRLDRRLCWFATLARSFGPKSSRLNEMGGMVMNKKAGSPT